MVQKLFLTISALLLGLAVGALTLGGAGAPAEDAPQTGAAITTTAADYARIVDGLSATLELEVIERQRLEDEVETMAAQIARLERRFTDTREPAAGAATAAASAESGPEAIALLASVEELQTDSGLTPFLEAGFDPERADYVKQLQDDLALQRLYLRDQAEREGWLRTTRYREGMQAIAQREQGLRQDLGEEDYDRYLYAIGRPNRVLVGDVLQNGPAQEAGIQAGDAIVSYGGTRIYDAQTLVGATRDGSAGASTAVEIERAGQTQLVYVPRGPLGINLRVSRVKP